MPRDKVTLREVAAHAGVSIATVSRVLSGRNPVGPELAERVRASIAALGYRPNRAARTLRTRTSTAIGLMISDVENPFFTSVVRAVEDIAHKRDFTVLLCNTDEDLDKETLYVDLLIEQQVAGVIFSPSTTRAGAARRFLDAGIPGVCIDRRIDDVEFDTVLVDNVEGAALLARHLLDDGHTTIGMIAGTTQATPSRDRIAGCRAVVESDGRATLHIREGELGEAVRFERTVALAQRLTGELLAMDPRPTALFSANSLLTQGALRALRERDLRVPDDVALVGFDDLPLYDLLEPPLTVVAQPTAQVGQVAAELVFRRLDDPDAEPTTMTLPAELRVRASCALSHSSPGRADSEEMPNEQ